ncbi:MAG: hypothetical protein WCZ18_10795 [Ottowia sp.]|nr:hypothetical protein [Ottowia sp.]
MPTWIRAAALSLATALLAVPALAGGGWDYAYHSPYPAAGGLHCDDWSGNARKVCKERRKGRRKIAKTYRKAERDPGPESSYKLAKTRIKARYKVRKQWCKSLPGEYAQDLCKDDAKRWYKMSKHALGPEPDD